jgi:hypothetical protein
MSEDEIINGGQHLSRAQRRELKKLAHRVDKITQADRRFFERFPERQHRMRIASRAEIQQAAMMMNEEVLPLAPDHIYFAVIKNVVKG